MWYCYDGITTSRMTFQIRIITWYIAVTICDIKELKSLTFNLR